MARRARRGEGTAGRAGVGPLAGLAATPGWAPARRDHQTELRTVCFGSAPSGSYLEPGAPSRRGPQTRSNVAVPSGI